MQRFLLAVIIFLAPLFSNSFAAKNSDFIIAKVNKTVLTNFELQDRYNFLTKFSKISVKSPSEKEIFLRQIVDKMVDEELIRQEAEKFGIQVSEAELQGTIEAIASQKKQRYRDFKKSFAARGLSFDNYKKQVETDLLWSKIVAQSLRAKIKISEHQIREFLEQYKIETDSVQFKIAEIFIPNKNNAKDLAQKLALDLKNGADFQDFVRQFSQSPTMEYNGEIGWVSKSDIHNKIYEAIKNLQINSHSSAIFINDGYYIFKLLDKKSVPKIDDEVRNFARNRIFARELEIEGRAYLMELRKNSFVEVRI